MQYGLARWVRVIEPQKLQARPARSSSATVTDKKSPIAAGYDDTLPIYYAGAPIFQVGLHAAARAGVASQRPRREERSRRAAGPPVRPAAGAPEAGAGRGRIPDCPKTRRGTPTSRLPRAEDRPRVIVSFAKEADKLLLSGMLEAGDEIAGKPVVIDAPRGKGHILLFANNPMWRQNTQGSYALVTNAIMNWDHLR